MFNNGDRVKILVGYFRGKFGKVVAVDGDNITIKFHEEYFHYMTWELEKLS